MMKLYVIWFSFSSEALVNATGVLRDAIPRLSLLLPTDSSDTMEFLSPNGGLCSACVDSIARGNLRGTSSLVLGASFC